MVEQSRGSIKRQAYRKQDGPLKYRKGFEFNIRKAKPRPTPRYEIRREQTPSRRRS